MPGASAGYPVAPDLVSGWATTAGWECGGVAGGGVRGIPRAARGNVLCLAKLDATQHATRGICSVTGPCSRGILLVLEIPPAIWPAAGITRGMPHVRGPVWDGPMGPRSSVGTTSQGKGRGSREVMIGQAGGGRARGVRGRWAPPPTEGNGSREGQR